MWMITMVCLATSCQASDPSRLGWLAHHRWTTLEQCEHARAQVAQIPLPAGRKLVCTLPLK